MPPLDPEETYLGRRAFYAARADALSRRDARLADLRLAVFLLGAGLAVWVIAADSLRAVWLGLPVAMFLALVVAHDRVWTAKARTAQALQLYDQGLRRLRGTWAGHGNPGNELRPEEHPYAVDLDLFGLGSLFELLCTARTQAGERALAAWLLAPASPEEVRARQAAVEEMRQRVDLREELALVGRAVRAHLHPEQLAAWGEAPAVFARPRGLRIIAWALALAATLGLASWPFSPWGPVPFLAVLVVEIGVMRVLKTRILRAIAAVTEPGEELATLAGLLAHLESQPPTTPWLAARRERLVGAEISAAHALARLRRLVTWLDAQRNQFFFPIGFVLMWALHFSLAIEAWRQTHGHRLRSWFAALGELEALHAVAGYAFEHPTQPFPELIEGPARLLADDAGHPLMPIDTCVTNSVSLEATGVAVWVVSGSNMSGKSTLLRTLGANVVLAQLGAPVRAQRMRMSSLQIGATLRVEDSLREGRSRFYAEIQRLQHIVKLTEGAAPVLFLLDEILHGTNSHDRQIGADAVVRSLIDAGAIGLVTTHDLALARTADELGARARNVHFVDTWKGDRLDFDYRLHEGVVQKSNALALMRSVGLKV